MPRMSNADISLSTRARIRIVQRKMSLKAPTSGRFSTQAAAPTRRMTTAPGANTAKAAQPLQPKSLNTPAATLAAPVPPQHSATHAAPTAAAKPAIIAKPTVSIGTVPIARRATLAASDKKVPQLHSHILVLSALLICVHFPRESFSRPPQCRHCSGRRLPACRDLPVPHRNGPCPVSPAHRHHRRHRRHNRT